MVLTTAAMAALAADTKQLAAGSTSSGDVTKNQPPK
jgi:hypothetical protein